MSSDGALWKPLKDETPDSTSIMVGSDTRVDSDPLPGRLAVEPLDLGDGLGRPQIQDTAIERIHAGGGDDGDDEKHTPPPTRCCLGRTARR